MLAVALLASAIASAKAAQAAPAQGPARRAPAVPQKAIICPGSALSPIARIGPGQLLLLSCGDGRRFLQVRVQGRPLAAMPVSELWPGADWELRDSPRLPVRSRTRSLVPLLLAQKSPRLERVVVVAADFEANTLSTAFAGPAAPAVTYAFRDLDGDGIPELRLGLDDGKRREVRTFTMTEPAAPFTGVLAGALGGAAGPLCASAPGAAASVPAAAPGAGASAPATAAPGGGPAQGGECDPVLDFDVEARTLPDAVYLFARGRDRLCGSGGCALSIVRVAQGAGREVLRDFGLWTIGPALAGRPPCVVIRNREGPPQKRCWRGKDYGE